jgi:hypothetical protein
MRGQEVALAEQNQALTQQLENLRAPQNLATAAHKLDMVASPTFGTIDVDSLAVSGSPEPATGSDAPAVLVPPPAVATPSATVAPAAPVEEEPAAEASADAADQSAPADGGTIPAPAQAAPGQ